MTDKQELDKLWNDFQNEAEYITLDGKIQLKTIAIDFAEYVLKRVSDT